MHANVLICPFCRAAIVTSSGSGLFKRSVREALSTWARSIRFAPRRFWELVRSVDVRDEVVRRIATEVVRRELRWRSVPSVRRNCPGRNLDPNAIDPFEISLDDLRTRSEHLRTCGACETAGLCVCSSCSLSGEIACERCMGSGSVTKLGITGRQTLACDACNQAGWIACTTCGGSGQTVCSRCAGDGYHVVWLEYEERDYWIVDSVPGDSPVLVAYPRLREARPLSTVDLSPFTVKARYEAEAPHILTPDDEDSRDAALRARCAIEPRVERVRSQQYLRLGVVRRDVEYAMCATTGHVVLCGRDLIGVTTPHAVRPIHVRNVWWVALAIGLFALGRVAVLALQGRAAYFANFNAWLNVLWIAGTLTALPVLGGMLRSLRAGLGNVGLRVPERVLEWSAIASVVAMLTLKIAVQPKPPEAKAALSSGETARARLVVDALKEAWGESPEIRHIENDVLVAEAADLPLPARLRILDRVAQAGGRQATEAALSARNYRLAEIRRLLDIGEASEALARIDRWFSTQWHDDAELSEARAQAEDQQWGRCASDDICSFLCAQAANDARSTPERAERVLAARQRLLDALSSQGAFAKPDPALAAQRAQVLARLTREPTLLRGDAELNERTRLVLAQTAETSSSLTSSGVSMAERKRRTRVRTPPVRPELTDEDMPDMNRAPDDSD